MDFAAKLKKYEAEGQTDYALLSVFVHGLLPVISKELARTGQTTFQDAIDQAARLETLERRTESRGLTLHAAQAEEEREASDEGATASGNGSEQAMLGLQQQMNSMMTMMTMEGGPRQTQGYYPPRDGQSYSGQAGYREQRNYQPYQRNFTGPYQGSYRGFNRGFNRGGIQRPPFRPNFNNSGNRSITGQHLENRTAAHTMPQTGNPREHFRRMEQQRLGLPTPTNPGADRKDVAELGEPNQRYCLIHDSMGHQTEACRWLKGAQGSRSAPVSPSPSAKKVVFQNQGN